MPYVIKESVVKSVLRMTKVGSNQLQRNHRPKGDEKFTRRLGQEAKYNFPCGAHSRHSSPFSLAAQNLVPDLPRPSGLHSKYARGYYFICKKDLGYEISTYLYSLPSPPPRVPDFMYGMHGNFIVYRTLYGNIYRKRGTS